MKESRLEKKDYMEITTNRIQASLQALNQEFGAIYSNYETIFRVWAPQAEEVKVNIFRQFDQGPDEVYTMKRIGDFFECTCMGDYDGAFYPYSVDGVETTAPYAKSSAINSTKSAVVDLSTTNPEGFENTSYVEIRPEDAIIYEVHLGDFTMDSSSGAHFPGKYLGFAELGLSYKDYSVGLSHLKELGVTHIHLLPLQDFISVDERPERFGDDNNYNWGYDPESYFAPEGSYSLNPYDPKSRITELKKLIQTIHDCGMGVIFDVVYNHTFKTIDSNLNILAPGYYHRSNEHGFTNGSGVGNEIASERPMVRKLIIDSLTYWQQEYKIDGYRFDLMSLTDIDTIEMAISALRRENEYTIIYGEPWGGGPSALPDHRQTLWGRQANRKFALFNERFRDAIRGDNDGHLRGFVQGNPVTKHAVEIGLLGSIQYNYSYNGGIRKPGETVNYFNAHDNLIFEDKLKSSVGEIEAINQMTRLAFGILLTSQGIPFFHAGNEFRRNKQNNRNSYNAPYRINAIDWTYKEKYYDLYEYVRDLIQLRKDYPELHQYSDETIRDSIEIIPSKNPNLITVLYKLDRGWMVILHYNGWEESTVSWSGILERIRREKAVIERIFDENGRVKGPRFSIEKASDEQLYLSRLSTTIYRIY